jgi:glutamate racemase
MRTDNRPIGVFDSGIGGFTVLNHLKQTLPTESFIYVADNANKPFGDKSPLQILRINDQIITYLMTQEVKLIVIACNTSSAIALKHDKRTYPIPFVDMLVDGLWFAQILQPKIRVGVIATKATVHSHAFEKMLLQYNPHIEVLQQACPKLVPLIEQFALAEQQTTTDTPELEQAIDEYVRPFKDHDILILGCSHYPHIRKNIEDKLPNSRVIDPSEYVSRRVKEHIEIMGFSDREPSNRFCFTADEAPLEANAKRFGFQSFEKIRLV